MSRRAASCLDSFGSGCFAIQASSDAMAAGSSYTTIAPVEGLVELEAAKRPLAQGVRPRHDHSKSLAKLFHRPDAGAIAAPGRMCGPRGAACACTGCIGSGSGQHLRQHPKSVSLRSELE